MKEEEVFHSNSSRSICKVTAQLNKTIPLTLILLSTLAISFIVMDNTIYDEFAAFAVNNTSAVNQTTLDVKEVYDQKTLQFDNTIHNVVVLIPNEAHESINQKKSQWPLANAPYIPQNLVINRGTSVTWFNADVDHDHIIKFEIPVNGNISETETFPYLSHTTVVFNKPGQYSYFEDGDLNDDKSFKMTGTVRVIDSADNAVAEINKQTPIKTVGFLMVPSKDSETITSSLTNDGYNVLGSYTFNDLRGGQKGTGPTQTIIVWGSDKDDVEQVLQPIIDITKELPYS
jgi:plastocyanin